MERKVCDVEIHRQLSRDSFSLQGMCVCSVVMEGMKSKHSLSYMARGELRRNVALSVLCSQEVRHKTMNEPMKTQH